MKLAIGGGSITVSHITTTIHRRRRWLAETWTGRRHMMRTRTAVIGTKLVARKRVWDRLVLAQSNWRSSDRELVVISNFYICQLAIQNLANLKSGYIVSRYGNCNTSGCLLVGHLKKQAYFFTLFISDIRDIFYLPNEKNYQRLTIAIDLTSTSGITLISIGIC